MVHLLSAIIRVVVPSVVVPSVVGVEDAVRIWTIAILFDVEVVREMDGGTVIVTETV